MLQSRSWMTDEKLVVESTIPWGATEEAKAYFFAPRIASFAALATRNLTTVLAGILIFCCVLGLMPVRAFLLLHQLAKAGQNKFAFFFDRFISKVRHRSLRSLLCPKSNSRPVSGNDLYRGLSPFSFVIYCRNVSPPISLQFSRRCSLEWLPSYQLGY